jgi:uncharacterized protein YbjQ (UPF0145 family)
MADDSATAEQRQLASIAALERGELPLAARERIDELRSPGAAWTSDLSVAELAAIGHAGFEPVGMVMGSAVYRMATQWGYNNVFGGGVLGGQGLFATSSGNTRTGEVRSYPCTHGWGMGGMRPGMVSTDHRWGYNWEHTMFADGVLAARDAALSRILEEARGLDAHGVVGVRLIRRYLEGVGNSLEFTVIGTAIRRSGGPRLAQPFMSHLDGVAFGKLVHGGYVPVSLVIGVGAVEIDPGCTTEWMLRSWNNARVDQVSDGIEMARMLGISRLEGELDAVDADGAVGVDVEFTEHALSGGGLLVELVSIGTAVRRYAKDPMDEVPLPIMRLR